MDLKKLVFNSCTSTPYMQTYKHNIKLWVIAFWNTLIYRNQSEAKLQLSWLDRACSEQRDIGLYETSLPAYAVVGVTHRLVYYLLRYVMITSQSIFFVELISTLSVKYIISTYWLLKRIPMSAMTKILLIL